MDHRIQISIKAAAILALVTLVQPQRAEAYLYPPHPGLKIYLTLDKSKTTPPPGSDYGTRLDEAMAEAARQWEAIFAGIPSPGINIAIKYWWKNDPEGSKIIGTDNLYVPAKTLATAGTEQYNIKFYTKWSTYPLLSAGGPWTATVVDVPWYLDDNLTDLQEEFDFQQTLYRDLSSVPFMTGSPPPLMEVAYRGSAIRGTKADGKLDLLTYALHQIGQTLLDCGTEPEGISSSTSRTCSLDSYMARFAKPGVTVTCVDDNQAAIDSLTKKMKGDDSMLGKRYLPSTFDIFLITASRGLLNPLYLPHREMLYPLAGGSTTFGWINTAEWLGSQVPDANSDAYVRDTGITAVQLGGTASARDLYVGWESSPRRDFKTGAHQLTLSGDLTIDRSDTDFVIETGGQVDVAGDASIVQGGLLEMDGGRILAGGIDVDPDSEIYGDGELYGPLVNNGLIDPSDNGPLKFYANGTSLDLDGEGLEEGLIEAQMNGIEFHGPLADSFDGTMSIAKYVTLTEPWTIAGMGLVEFTAPGAQLTAPGTTVQYGTLLVNAVDASLFSPATFKSGAQLHVPSGGDSLHLKGDTIFEAGAFDGNGTLHQEGNVTVPTASSIVIDVQTYNWDGETCGGPAPIGHMTTLQDGASFEITGAITTCAGDGYDGTVTVGPGATLIVDGDWRLDGKLILDGGTVSGSGELTNYGTIQGTGTINVVIHNYGIFHCDAAGSISYAAGSTGIAGC